MPERQGCFVQPDKVCCLFAEMLIDYHPANGLTIPQLEFISLYQCSIDVVKLPGHPELAFFEGLGDVFTCLPDQTKFKVMYGCGGIA